ncbi:Hexokinase [Schistosoma japonicum]|uniref:Phosphotransferase n=1 Tax=Schistosoma japonicum TaxID=6182 RepID=A0A4Z2DGI9_SCHJA|nr:Hexokinase [Schistosoma japonicum]TNN15603.1 Hexokinase [Schistosoma japonicum]
MVYSDEQLFEKVVEVLRPFDLSVVDYEEFCDKMDEAMRLGLQKSTNGKSSIKMFPSYVTKVPNGTETGNFLALDLGGTNYRVLSVTLEGKGKSPRIQERTYSIPAEKMSGTGTELFRYIAETLSDFLDNNGMRDKKFDLGFTFSFPCEQKGLTHATLVRWTKGFTADGVEGNNVAELLQNALDEHGLHVRCVAVVNDTVGTLASCALEDSKCAVGLIVGTGTNVAYIEDSSKVEMVDNIFEPEVIVNTEWGAFGENGELDCWRTQFDKAMDIESLHPGKQLFEKMVSGMYLGELVRHILVYLVEQKVLFRGKLPERLKVRNSLLTRYLTDVERDPAHLLYSTYYMLTEDLSVPVVEPVDNRIVRYTCEMVVKRAAYLAGAGIACILRRINRSEVTVGVDGSLFKFHLKFCERMTDMIDKLKPKNTRFCLRLSEDGSGKGAAAIAASCSRKE